MSLRVIVIEDDPRYRSTLEQLLRHADGFVPVASFADPVAAVREAESVARSGVAPPWDLVLTDLEMPGLDGIETTRRLKAAMPGVKVVVLTVFEEPSTILSAICAGADGYLLKKARAPELLSGLRAVSEGGAPLTPAVAKRVLDLMRDLGPAPGSGAPRRLDLTEREQQVLRGLVEGLSYKQVADVLGMGLGTVRTHVTGIYRKLQVHNVAEAVSRAVREGLV
jgi:DNA-binding NarL/FixJ family response regulator